MRGIRRKVVLGAVALALVATAAAVAAKVEGFKTGRAAQLVPLEAGVEIDPILSTGDTVGSYQMSGIPDGLGAYKDGGNTLQVVMNHELAGTAPPGVGSRISKVTIDRKSTSVLGARYLFTGAEGFLRFCSSTLEKIDGTPWYFTGEESTSDGRSTGKLGRGGSSVAVNAETGAWTETRHFGLLAHENVVPVERLSKAMIITSEDGDPGVNDSQLYAYVADTFAAAIAGNGQLYVWKSDSAGDGNPSTNDIRRGETLHGIFVPVSQAENASATTLEAAAQARSAFDFVRIEDVAVAQQGGGTVYFDDTGRLGSETVKGRLYRFDIDPANPLRASLTLVLDGDAGDDIVNPDNLDTSPHSVVIQEDRNFEHRSAAVSGGYGRILVYDVKDGSLRAVARVNTPPSLPPGEWESSGVINAQTLLGHEWWLVDVQAHGQSAPQPGPSLVPDSSTGEDGQLLAIRIPGS